MYIYNCFLWYQAPSVGLDWSATRIGSGPRMKANGWAAAGSEKANWKKGRKKERWAETEEEHEHYKSIETSTNTRSRDGFEERMHKESQQANALSSHFRHSSRQFKFIFSYFLSKTMRIESFSIEWDELIHIESILNCMLKLYFRSILAGIVITSSLAQVQVQASHNE